jgi:hypothetical protein
LFPPLLFEPADAVADADAAVEMIPLDASEEEAPIVVVVTEELDVKAAAMEVNGAAELLKSPSDSSLFF